MIYLIKINGVAMESLLTVEQTAKMLNVSKPTLARWRYEGQGPPYVSLSRRKVAYRQSDLEEWVSNKVYLSTSQYRE